jgi:hypothetical protein
MLTEIMGMPDGAIGFAATGVVTTDERRRVLEPQIDSAREGGKIRLLYMTGPDFAGYVEGALFDEAVFGTRHFTDFKKIAFVSDAGPYNRAVQALDGLMPAALKVFRTGDINAAKEWLAE